MELSVFLKAHGLADTGLPPLQNDVMDGAVLSPARTASRRRGLVHGLTEREPFLPPAGGVDQKKEEESAGTCPRAASPRPPMSNASPRGSAGAAAASGTGGGDARRRRRTDDHLRLGRLGEMSPVAPLFRV